MAMISLYIWLSAVLLSVSVHGSMIYVNGWSMTIADGVRAEEGGSAVLPCSFTHPDTRLTLTGSILWYKGKSWSLIFNCTYLGPDHSQGELCENVIQRDGWNRFRFVGNLSNKDASIMMEGLSLRDAGFYLCHVELNIGRIKSRILTNLEVKAARGNVPVVRGTEGDLVTLPCIFMARDSHTLTTVTWMRKEPYQHIVTFTAQSQGTWTTVHGGNRYDLIGNPWEGNASIRINQLNVRDNHTYLCQVEYLSKLNFQFYQYLIQKEVQLQVIPETFPIVILCIPLVVKLPPLLVMWIILYKQKTRSNSVNIAHKYWCVCVTDRERERERENILWERPLIVSEDAARHAELFQQFSFLIQRLSPGPRLTNQRKHPLCI
ncbi:uncharacterized protein LOC122557009 isoform X2 [Chiloscyllium plagiosum]|uniref:uncharacterized protein LOC122557009 isoform X2 n=1 Tax=Chiloscyllium plagiosum TaxID=36176 RepID=UPI001CB83FE5|nr:uncharacterized protein LOC122557009 isoform X2 [Chiloscyllium plagiosum]